MERFTKRGIACAGTVMAVVVLGGPTLQAAAAVPAAHAQFLTWNTKKHTATLTLTAGLTSVNHTLNFNGYTNGGLVVSVPKNYKVTVIFTNKSTFPHSAVFTLAADKGSAGSHPVAFAGASSPSPVAGTQPSETVTFSFKAKKVGSYAIICEVGHHADAGMWALFNVTTKKQPSVALTAPAPAPTPSPTP